MVTKSEYLDNALRQAFTAECVLWPFGRTPDGYGKVWRDGRTAQVHAIACEMVHGPRPPDRPHCRHLCGHTPCFNPRHLKWGTVAENAADKIAHGTHNRGENHNQHKLTLSEVLAIRAIYHAGDVTQRELAAAYGVARRTIGNIVEGNTWAAA